MKETTYFCTSKALSRDQDSHGQRVKTLVCVWGTAIGRTWLLFIGVMCFVSVIAARNLNDCLPCLPLKIEKQKRKSIFFYRHNFMLSLKGVWTCHFHFIDSREEIRRAGMPGDNVYFDTCVLTTPCQSLARKHRSFKLAPRLSPKKVLLYRAIWLAFECALASLYVCMWHVPTWKRLGLFETPSCFRNVHTRFMKLRA